MEPQFGHMRVTGNIPGGCNVEGNPNEVFVLHSMYILPWRGDLAAHAELFAKHIRDCRYTSEPVALGALGGVAEMLLTYWTRVECEPLELAVARMQEWRERVIQHAFHLAAEADEADEAGERRGSQSVATEGLYP